jgi:hypothetical protein
MRLLIITMLVLGQLSTVNDCQAQRNPWLYGAGVQLSLGLGQRGCTEYHISATAGAGRMLFNHNAVLTYQLTARLYRGGLGNSLLPSRQNDLQLDIANSFGLTGGYGRSFRDRPIHHWSATYPSAMTNPFLNSMTLATNLIWNRQGRSQQGGFMGIALGNTCIGYFNDGPPFHLTATGDTYDRWWTGSGYVQYFGGDRFGTFLAHFDKFTGFQPNAYELSQALRLNNVMYRDFEYMTYNRGRIGMTWVHSSGVGINASIHNRYDIQDFIHRVMKYPFHPSVYNPRLILGPQFQTYGTPKI